MVLASRGCCLWLGIEICTGGVSFRVKDRIEHLTEFSKPILQLLAQFLAKDQVTLIVSCLQRHLTFNSNLVSLLCPARSLRSL